MNLKYLKETQKDEFKIKRLQDKILEIVVYFDNFCKENNIKYFLMGGSALGAMRHSGFIPWDDDFDVFMDFNNYQKLLNCIDNIDKKRFYFQKQDTYEQPYYFSKLRINGTTFIDDYKKDDRNIHQGIFIDIMCLYNVPNSKLKQKIQYYFAALLKAKALIIYGYKTKSIKKKIILFLTNIIVNKYTKKTIYNYVKKYNNENTELVGHFFGRAKFKNSIYPKKCFQNQRYVSFEKLKLPVPNGVEEYLEIRYGKKYMEMPDEKTKKLYQTHASFWDVDKDYKEYLDKNNGGKYEKI